MVHLHGTYERYADVAGARATIDGAQVAGAAGVKTSTKRKGKKEDNQESIQRYLCCPCGRTFSVLPPHRLPYRPIRTERLQGDFDQRAGIQTPGLDPPPRTVERCCLERAWRVLTTRVATLKGAFGQLVESTVSDGLSLWKSLRQSFDSVAKMLCFLSEHHRISLLGDYRCLRPDG
jgi:hypothetical protein